MIKFSMKYFQSYWLHRRISTSWGYYSSIFWIKWSTNIYRFYLDFRIKLIYKTFSQVRTVLINQTTKIRLKLLYDCICLITYLYQFKMKNQTTRSICKRFPVSAFLFCEMFLYNYVAGRFILIVFKMWFYSK